MNKKYTPNKIYTVVFLSLVFLSLTLFQAYAQTSKGLDVSNLDPAVQPCQDFFMYANGGWLKKNPIPASESRWGSFNELDNKNNTVLREILEKASITKSSGSETIAQKVGNFYFSGMDSLSIEKAGITPLKADLDKINQLKDVEGLLTLNTQNIKRGVGGLYGMYVTQDEKKSTEYAIYFSQGGIGLPDRDYYLKDDKRSQNIMEEYKKHIQNSLVLLGDKKETAKLEADKIVAIEKELARASMTKVQQRDPYAIYNKMTLAEANQLAPKLNLNKRLGQLGVTGINSIIVSQPEFFKKANRLLDSVSINDWKTYLRWHLVRATAPMLNHAFVAENFHFYGTILTGAKEMQPRWKRISKSTNRSLGEALGKLYVDKAFSPKAKESALEMVNNLKWAFKEHIAKVDWMSTTTKEKAVAKLDAFVTKIGYPDKWIDYTSLKIDRSSYVLNVLRANEFESKRQLNRLGKPIDRTEWFMSPPTVNAYYNTNMNEIVFPAGILQPPYFDPEADDAVNYGGIGAVIGHEITHGFDDQGRQYDEVGNLKDWWAKEDADKFVQRTGIVEKQFSGYEVLDSVYINGQLTLGENIADLGGLSIAYTALQKALKDKTPGKIDGFTPEQRFFLAWAQIWRINMRDEVLRQQVLTDPHSPGKYRTNGTLSNMPEFHKAFNCKAGDKMLTPEESRAKIW